MNILIDILILTLLLVANIIFAVKGMKNNENYFFNAFAAGFAAFAIVVQIVKYFSL